MAAGALCRAGRRPYFDWTPPSGQPAGFEGVDVLEVADDGRVSALHIIYDTVTARPAFEAEKGVGGSWRPGLDAV